MTHIDYIHRVDVRLSEHSLWADHAKLLTKRNLVVHRSFFALAKLHPNSPLLSLDGYVLVRQYSCDHDQ